MTLAWRVSVTYIGIDFLWCVFCVRGVAFSGPITASFIERILGAQWT